MHGDRASPLARAAAPSYQWRMAVTLGHDWKPAMTDIVLKDIDEFLLERIRRVADRRGWSLAHALHHLLEQGLYAVEGDGRLSFDTSEADVLQAAIAALEDVPDGVFSMIGQLPDSGSR
jgi:hypothetical protein